MSSEAKRDMTLVNAEFERRGLRYLLYFVLLFGIVVACIGSRDAAVVAAVALAGLASSCRPIAA